MTNRRFLCNVNTSELTHGGQKSPGRDRLLSSDYKDLTLDEIAAEIERLLADGFWLQVRVDAHRDKRKQAVKNLYPTPWQKTARWYT